MRMRVACVGLLVLWLSSVAFAQEAKTGYAGGSVGIATVVVFSVVPISVHGGFGLDALGGRVDAVYYVGGAGVQLGANAIFRAGPPVEGQTSGYGGGGPRLIVGADGIGFGVGGLGGLEYFVSDEAGIFGEARLDLLLAGGFTLPIIGVAFGANFYF